MKRVFVGLSGASGAVYGLTLVRTLVEAGVEVPITLTESGAKVLKVEMDLEVDFRAPDLDLLFPGHGGAVRFFPLDCVEAPVSSGSYRTDAAVICPCSMGTLGSIAAGTSFFSWAISSSKFTLGLTSGGRGGATPARAAHR